MYNTPQSWRIILFVNFKRKFRKGRSWKEFKNIITLNLININYFVNYYTNKRLISKKNGFNFGKYIDRETRKKFKI